MKITKDEYEFNMLQAFREGMIVGYGIEHTNIEEEERRAVREFAGRMGFRGVSMDDYI